jgi:Mg-chelatase subunit ChlD
MAYGSAVNFLRCILSLALCLPFLLPASTALAQTFSEYTFNSATVLVIDISNSMAEPWQGGVKIGSAKTAANQIVNMLEQESRLGGQHQVAIVAFSTAAELLLPLTGDYAQARRVIDGLSPQAYTNIHAALSVANQAMAQASPNENRIIVLLSDGNHTVDTPSIQDILPGPVAEAARRKNCIYTVGFGDPNDLNEDLLKQIASGSGCGAYYYGANVSELQKIYIRIRHQSTGVLLGAPITGTLSQGQTDKRPLNVPAGQAQLRISLFWPGSQINLTIRDPGGNAVQNGQAGPSKVTIMTYANLVYAVILNPIPGQWMLELFGADLPQPETFEALASVVAAPPTLTPPPAPPTPTPLPLPVATGGEPGFPIALVLVLVGGGLVGLYVYSQSLNRNRALGQQPHRPGASRDRLGDLPPPVQAGFGKLYFASGPLAGSVFPCTAQSISLGRAPVNSIVLADSSVSRLHAVLQHSGGRWTLIDQRSQSGTYVNGSPISRSPLRDGDHIQIGISEIIFRVERM